MGYLIRVVKGNVNEAVRQIMRHVQADNQAKYHARNRYNIKPCQRRRQAKEESIRRRNRTQLMQNLRAVFGRKARGF